MRVPVYLIDKQAADRCAPLSTEPELAGFGTMLRKSGRPDLRLVARRAGYLAGKLSFLMLSITDVAYCFFQPYYTEMSALLYGTAL
jgi:hypothetical protein